MGAVGEELSNVDVSDVAFVRFVTADGDSFVIKRAGISRVARRIAETFKKTEFRAGELARVYEKATPFVRSSLPKKDLEVLLEKLRRWIEV